VILGSDIFVQLQLVTLVTDGQTDTTATSIARTEKVDSLR